VLLASCHPCVRVSGRCDDAELARFVREHEARERRLLTQYCDALRRCGVEQSDEAALALWEWEVAAYFATALAQLSVGLTPAVAVTNRRYGWLTHEFDGDALAWLMCRGLLAVWRLAGRPSAPA